MFGLERKENAGLVKQEVIHMNLGKNIAELRKKNNLTQEELANMLGVSPQAVSKWENDAACPDIALLPKIAEIFGVTIDELMNEQGSINSKKTVNSRIETKRIIQINVLSADGKSSKINIPFKLVSAGMKIGAMFGLDDNICCAINTAVESEVIDDLITVDGDNGEKVTIKII
ncbi:MAG: helix-turn-helix domain-containing protein [Eubacterium sp.]|nr:helix-turn-helix domain-containing protein [Eubacterium sp.]